MQYASVDYSIRAFESIQATSRPRLVACSRRLCVEKGAGLCRDSQTLSAVEHRRKVRNGIRFL